MLTPQEVEDFFTRAGVRDTKHRGDWRDGCCPLHDDHNASFSYNVKSGGWSCHTGCGSGDLKAMSERTGVPLPEKRPERKSRAARTVEATYDYRDENGSLLFQAVRYRVGDKKDFRQRKPDGNGGWDWKLGDTRRVLYNLPRIIAADPGEPIFLVEGEKDADNLTALGLLATTSPMGAGKWMDDYAIPLKDRDVIAIPDNDEPGREHMEAAAKSLAGVAKRIRILTIDGLPPKGDVSDWLVAGGNREALIDKANGAPDWTPPAAPAEPVAPDEDDDADLPYIPLGHSDGVYYYFNRQTGQVSSMTAANHVKLYLLAFAPLNYWSRNFGTDNGGVSWTSAASAMMANCVQKGIFDPAAIRGRGAWYEDGKPVVHLGDRIIIDGQPAQVGQPRPGGFIYPAAIPIRIAHENPLGNREAVKLGMLAEFVSWERPINARLFSGWLALAPICGALNWRPHIWLSGPAGCGKSWLADNIMRPILGRVGLFVQSDTTEAGIRQALGYDARPVLFDEAEGETERAQVRMANVMALMRQSSSENGSVIVKGSATGAVKVYSIRSCFAFSSIGVGIKQHSDSTRVTVLSIRKVDGDEGRKNFDAIRRATAALLTDGWVASLHARMIALIPVVRANAETFAHAAAKQIGSQCMGDQIGALLAGAYALHSTEAISLDAAREWVDKQDWSEQASINETPDEVLCLQRILQHTLRIPDSNGRVNELSIAELIEAGRESMDPQSASNRAALLRLGIRVDGDAVTIANAHPTIQNILRGTPWGDWSRVLRRLPGASVPPHPVRFAGVKARGTTIPLSAISN